MQSIDLSGLGKILTKNKYVWLVLALGLALLLLPGRTARSGDGYGTVGQTRTAGVGAEMSASGIPLDTEAERIAALLEQIDGVGKAAVLISEAGAVVVCTGGDDPAACYQVTNAVSAYTGLGSDKISVMKMKSVQEANEK